MGRRISFILIALTGLAFAVIACDDSTTSSQNRQPYQPSALELAARETAQAEATREAMLNEARGTSEALANERQATQQAIDLQASAVAQSLHATREVWELQQTQEAAYTQATATRQAVEATATRQAVEATATIDAIHATATRTAEREQATATAIALIIQVEATQHAANSVAIQATAQAIQRQDERERVTQPLRAWWIWVVLAFALPCVGWLGWRVAKVLEARSRVIRRKADEGEPFVLLEQTDEQGNRRIALPLRSFNALMDTGQVPALPAPGMQDAATMRQQTANAIQARQVAATTKAKNAHKSKAPKIIAPPTQPGPQMKRKRRQVPGLVKVVAVSSLDEATQQGILPPPLAETIQGQWEEVDEEQ